jgi:hypothetical protein
MICDKCDNAVGNDSNIFCWIEEKICPPDSPMAGISYPTRSKGLKCRFCGKPWAFNHVHDGTPENKVDAP